jgi:hypothetical protein
MKTYIYKLVSDDGGAPCVTDELLTLAICKPAIRSTAKPGDMIIGFGSNELQNRLVYIAKVTDKLVEGKYYESPEYYKRGDCIYERTKSGALVWKKGSKFHLNNLGIHRDIGQAPHYKKANVLLSDNFRYYGDSNNQEYKIKYPELNEFVRKIGQGHRVHSFNGLDELIQDLINDSFESIPKMKVGNPSHKFIYNKVLQNEECSCVQLYDNCIRKC